MNDFHRTVSEIVRSDYRTADVFKKYGINYCCNGQVPLEEACAGKNLELEVVVNELEYATRNINLSNSLQFVDWKIDFSIDYIVNMCTMPISTSHYLRFRPAWKLLLTGIRNSFLTRRAG